MTANDLNMRQPTDISVIACGSSIIPRSLTGSSQSPDPLHKTAIFKKMQKSTATLLSKSAPAWSCIFTTVSMCLLIPSHLSTLKSFPWHLKLPQLICIFALLHSLFTNLKKWQNYIPGGWNAQFDQRTGAKNTNSVSTCGPLILRWWAEITSYRMGIAHSKRLQPLPCFSEDSEQQECLCLTIPHLGLIPPKPEVPQHYSCRACRVALLWR